MAIPPLSTLTHRQVADLLPAEEKQQVIAETGKARGKWQKIYNVSSGEKVTKNSFPVLIVLGILAVIGAAFVLLAAHKVLPQSANAISDLGMWGQVIGYSAGGLGVLALIIGGILTYRAYRHNKRVALVQSESEEWTGYNSEQARMFSYFPWVLNPQSVVAVDQPKEHSIIIYYQATRVENGPFFGQRATISYENTTPAEAYVAWCKEHAAIVQGKSFLDLGQLQELVQQSESKRKPKVVDFATIAEKVREQAQQNSWNSLQESGKSVELPFVWESRGHGAVVPKPSSLIVDGVSFTSVAECAFDADLKSVTPFNLEAESCCYFITSAQNSDDIASFEAYLSDPTRALTITKPAIVLKLSAKENV